MFPIHRVYRSSAVANEPLGSKQKFWYRDGQRQILFKAELRGTGDDWAEVVACHLCKLLGLPHVEYEMAELWDGPNRIGPGVVCQNIAMPPMSLVLGNELLLAQDPKYPVEGRRRVRQHTIAAVAEAVSHLEMPGTGWADDVPGDVQTAVDVFAGYLMLDAWIANQDRHHENWGVVRDDGLRLAPTYDHGASLARNLSDAERLERLNTRDENRKIPFFAKRAQSALFSGTETARPLGTLDAFVEFGQRVPSAARAWVSRLGVAKTDDLLAILVEVPNHRMSNICKEFTLALLMVNRDRILATEWV